VQGEARRGGQSGDESLRQGQETVAALEAADRGEVVTVRTIEEMFADLKTEY
jgi:predicted DNA-binding transcriptional regulator YafY